jgi:phage shock protein PspC (stress-responsive transcriptional regulator)
MVLNEDAGLYRVRPEKRTSGVFIGGACPASATWGKPMDLILIIIVLLLLFGGGLGYSRYGYRGGIGIGGILLIILVLYLLLGHGRI